MHRQAVHGLHAALMQLVQMFSGLRCALLPLLWTWALSAAAAPLDFDVPAGPAALGVTRFAQQAGVPVLFPYTLLEQRRTRAVRGRYETAVALAELLRGSGLVAVSDDNGQFRLLPAPRPDPGPGQRPVAGLDAAGNDLDAGNHPLAEVAITGSRIERDGMSMPTPVTVISKLELDALEPGSVVDALVQLPQFLNNDTPQTQSFGTAGAAGASFLNLRGAGSVRTLVLLDGRRVTPSTRNGTVDIAQLPRGLLRRVEIVTGGASAAYGSDAVSGVVNLMLDDTFTGFRLQAQQGETTRSDYQNHELSLAWGQDVGDRTSLLFAGEFAGAHGIRGYASRDWFQSEAAIENPAAGGPAEVIASNVHATGYTYGGLITSGPLAGTQFLAGGVPAPFVRGTLATSTTQSGGSGVDPAADLVWILPDQSRSNGFLRLTTRPTDATTLFAQLLAARSASHYEKDPPALWGPWEATIYADNAFLPDSLRSAMAGAGISSFKLGRLGNGDLGRPQVDNVDSLLSSTLGLQHHGTRWQLDAYYQYGHNRSALHYTDTLRIDRIYRAIDSVRDPASGRIVCRSTLSFPDDGCVPVDLFGPGSVSAAALRYLLDGSSAQIQTVQEHVAEATLQGSLLHLPAGPVQVVAGASWRLESMATHAPRYPAELDGLIVTPDTALGYRGLPAAYAGQPNIFERTTTIEVSGHYAVRELFGEVVMPLLATRRLAETLDLHGAFRITDYSGSGRIPAWKLGLNWQVDRTLRLRATRSRDIRAGSLAERYDASTAGVTIVDRLLPLPRSYAVVGERTGNPAVDPEKADTTTAGLVVQPAFAPALSLSADYYDIHIHDAISLLGVQNIIDRCAALPGDAVCGLIERNASTGLISRVRNLVLNVAAARSRGIDIELSWRHPVNLFGGAESMALRAFANHTLESSVVSGTGQRVDRAGQTGLGGGAPGWQANLSFAYRRGSVQATVQERLISSGSYNATYGTSGGASGAAADIDDNRVRGASYTTLRLAWDPPRLAGITLFATVSNLFDASPPRAGDWGFLGSIPTNESLFDVLGRRFVLGLQLQR